MTEWDDLSREAKLILIVIRRRGPGVTLSQDEIVDQAQELEHLSDAEIEELRAQMVMSGRN